MIKHNYPGKFIVIEGLDGSGKSSQVEFLVQYLKDRGKEVLFRSEPTSDLPVGKKIRQVLRKEIVATSMELQKMYVEDRTQHLSEKVIPALKDGKYVVCSRYAFSTIAYGTAAGLNTKMLMELNDHFLLPDATIVISVSPKECIKRIEARGEGKELFDKEQRLVKADVIYQNLPQMYENVFIINGEKPVLEVFEQIKKVIEKI